MGIYLCIIMNNLINLAEVDKPGKVTHPRRMKLTRVNELLRFDLSLG